MRKPRPALLAAGPNDREHAICYLAREAPMAFRPRSGARSVGANLGESRGGQRTLGRFRRFGDCLGTDVSILQPYLVFVGDVGAAKTALGVRDWAAHDCCAQWRFEGGADLGLPDACPAKAVALGARSLLIGVAPRGAGWPARWIPPLIEALDAGLDVVSGVHARLGDIPEVAKAARLSGRRVVEIRRPDAAYPIASGARRSGRRVLTVGTDCGVGKKYAALALTRAFQARGVPATFRASGQTGMIIAGAGIAIDAVVSDFAAGAAECLSPSAPETHWDVIEGQGAIFHPAYAGVTLSLLHGSQPDMMVLCHDVERTEIAGFPGFPIRPLDETIAMYESLARVTNPDSRVVALALNTSRLADAAAQEVADTLGRRHALPCFDPMRFGAASVAEALLAA